MTQNGSARTCFVTFEVELQDFKEAARLAAEAKILSADAESGMERAQALRQQAQEAEAEEAATAAELDALASDVEAAAAAAAAAHLKRLLVGIKRSIRVEAVQPMIIIIMGVMMHEAVSSRVLESSHEASCSKYTRHTSPSIHACRTDALQQLLQGTICFQVSCTTITL